MSAALYELSDAVRELQTEQRSLRGAVREQLEEIRHDLCNRLRFAAVVVEKQRQYEEQLSKVSKRVTALGKNTDVELTTLKNGLEGVAAAVHAVRPALDAEVEHRVEAEDRLAERVKCSLAELGQRVLADAESLKKDIQEQKGLGAKARLGALERDMSDVRPRISSLEVQVAQTIRPQLEAVQGAIEGVNSVVDGVRKELQVASAEAICEAERRMMVLGKELRSEIKGETECRKEVDARLSKAVTEVSQASERRLGAEGRARHESLRKLSETLQARIAEGVTNSESKARDVVEHQSSANQASQRELYQEMHAAHLKVEQQMQSVETALKQESRLRLESDRSASKRSEAVAKSCFDEQKRMAIEFHAQHATVEELSQAISKGLEESQKEQRSLWAQGTEERQKEQRSLWAKVDDLQNQLRDAEEVAAQKMAALESRSYSEQCAFDERMGAVTAEFAAERSERHRNESATRELCVSHESRICENLVAFQNLSNDFEAFKDEQKLFCGYLDTEQRSQFGLLRDEVSLLSSMVDSSITREHSLRGRVSVTAPEQLYDGT